MGYIIPNYLHSFFGSSILCGYNINSFEIELLGSDDINDKNKMKEFIKNIFGEKLSSLIDDKFYEISLDNEKKNIIWDIDLPDKFSRVFQDKNCDKSINTDIKSKYNNKNQKILITILYLEILQHKKK